MKGVLYVVATPIGNLEDITLRALNVLKEVDIIAAEDTRHTLKLLNHFGIKKRLISYWSEREKLKAQEITERLNEGLSVALVSDAGTPGIQDPGGELVRRAIEAGVEVVAVPGPSASIAALSVSGLDTSEFTFIGFLPSKKSERAKKLKELAVEERTLIFYEAPHRLIDTLSAMEETFKERNAALAKEITKMHEEVIRGGFRHILDVLEGRTIAGEYVIVVEGRPRRAEGAPLPVEEALAEVKALMKKGSGRKEAVKSVAESYGLSKKELYDRSLQ
ncbi:MAG: 16S rRNA (cytidine(1402)-2'-O)-methyltransferase [Nitrospiraceae bacterium]|nr:16S rRNA (cytidine(1402)-2'-O)-methyltransferase [Nitrospiraceae bacterium]